MHVTLLAQPYYGHTPSLADLAFSLVVVCLHIAGIVFIIWFLRWLSRNISKDPPNTAVDFNRPQTGTPVLAGMIGFVCGATLVVTVCLSVDSWLWMIGIQSSWTKWIMTIPFILCGFIVSFATRRPFFRHGIAYGIISAGNLLLYG